MILAIEGITNSGKTTLCNHIIHSHCFKFTTYDSNNIVHTHIKQITHDESNADLFSERTELLLYSALLAEKSKQIIKADTNFIVDRFSLSVFCYFFSKFSFDSSYLNDLVSFASNGIIPDFTVFIDVPLDTILSRAKQSPMSRKDLGLTSYYHKLRDSYISNLPYYSKEYLIVNGTTNETDLAEMVIGTIKKIM